MSVLTEDYLADINSVGLILGLTPTILAGLGPTVSEISLLSLRRPILAFFLSLGSPEIFLTRLTIYENPFDLRRNTAGALIVPELPRHISHVFSFVQYLVAFGAALNVLYLSWDLGLKSVLIWSCEYSFFPLIWSGSTAIPHILACLSLRASVSDKRLVNNNKGESAQRNQRSVLTRLRGFVGREIITMSNQPESIASEGLHIGPLGISLTIGAVFSGFAHYIWGTSVFSSLLFVQTRDAIGILMRYTASSLLCNFVLYFEIGGMRRLPAGMVSYRWIVQAEDSISTTTGQRTLQQAGVNGTETR